MIAANNGQPLQWPGDELGDALYACYLLNRIEQIVGHEAATACFMMGGYGDAETDARMQRAIRTIADHNRQSAPDRRGAVGLLEKWRLR
ncbi:hypothetical protein OEZ49_07310 [Ruegeria sp. WL0004]|uniref:Uncharacterized protein n=1 Tax=Ruegeria marisflavi TaxID=2984152 RepID=A0ABT2WP03_9RHOB|nr:hypothetical protein [Ruegeria sp. WL0004]MCU9837571.1 hypothetical protein [Ruegeria sp. WL0004]